MIGLTGYYGFGNVGDDLCLRNLLQFYGSEAVHVYVPRAEAARNVRAEFKVKVSTVNQFGKEKLDLLVFGGGDLIHDLALEALWPQRFISRVCCPVALVGVGIPHGEGCTLASERIGWLARKVVFAGFRDFNSMGIYTKLTGEQCCLAPDPAFLTEKVKVDRGEFTLVQHKGMVADYQRLYPEWYPSSFGEAMALYQESFNGNSLILNWHGMSPEQAVKEVAQAKGCVGVSLHFALLALSQGTPFKVYPYQGKCRSVLSVAACLQHVDGDAVLPVRWHERERYKLLQDYLKETLANLAKGDFSTPKLPVTPHNPESFKSLPVKASVPRRLKYWYVNTFQKYD